MKTISVSDEDYKSLMELVNELNTQDHDGQANPRMWTVDTTHERVTAGGYGDTYFSVVGVDGDCSIKLDELNEELLKSYEEYGSLENLDDEYEGYIDSIEKFETFCKEHRTTVPKLLNGDSAYSLEYYLESIDIDVIAMEEYRAHELNATFFKDDAKTHIECNGHNLNKNPHTYAFTAYRMPKMSKLFAILIRLGASNDRA